MLRTSSEFPVLPVTPHMKTTMKAIAPALLSCVLALGCFLVCARIFHLPPVAIKVASIVIIATTSLAVLAAGAANLFRARAR